MGGAGQGASGADVGNAKSVSMAPKVDNHVHHGDAPVNGTHDVVKSSQEPGKATSVKANVVDATDGPRAAAVGGKANATPASVPNTFPPSSSSVVPSPPTTPSVIPASVAPSASVEEVRVSKVPQRELTHVASVMARHSPASSPLPSAPSSGTSTPTRLPSTPTLPDPSRSGSARGGGVAPRTTTTSSKPTSPTAAAPWNPFAAPQQCSDCGELTVDGWTDIAIDDGWYCKACWAAFVEDQNSNGDLDKELKELAEGSDNGDDGDDGDDDDGDDDGKGGSRSVAARVGVNSSASSHASVRQHPAVPSVSITEDFRKLQRGAVSST